MTRTWKVRPPAPPKKQGSCPDEGPGPEQCARGLCIGMDAGIDIEHELMCRRSTTRSRFGAEAEAHLWKWAAAGK